MSKKHTEVGRRVTEITDAVAAKLGCNLGGVAERVGIERNTLYIYRHGHALPGVKVAYRLIELYVAQCGTSDKYTLEDLRPDLAA